MEFSIYYLIAAEKADEKVRKVRGLLTVDHLRVSWEKSTTPYLSFFTRITRPKLTRYPPRAIRIPRPAESSYKDPVNAWLFFDGPLSVLRHHTKIVLDIPGGGYVAMNPRHHDDELLAWSGKTGLPVLSLDYRKAPEFPYPYALNECYDVYHTIVATLGRCIGLAGVAPPRIILTGDSAGANFATGLCLMILQSASLNQRLQDQEVLPIPEGLILIYPSLDLNIGNWMSDDQMSLIQDYRMRKTNKDILKRKSLDYYQLTPQTPKPSDDEDSFFPPPNQATENEKATPPLKLPTDEEIDLASHQTVARQTSTLASSKPKVLKTRLAVSSMISYFNDRVLTPEMMRAMNILYVGPHNRPDFSTDFLLSPLLAPEALLAKFPKTYFLTGERDPLVDDTVIFAGRIRQAKHNDFVQRKELGLIKAKEEFNEKDHVEVTLIPGISHGFLQFVSVFPEGWKHIFRCGRWIEEIFDANDQVPRDINQAFPQRSRSAHGRHHRRMPTGTESSGDEDRPLEMSSSITKEDGHAQHQSIKARRRRAEYGGINRNRSMVSLASEEDLLGRRMNGLAGGLMGLSSDGTQTP